MLDRPIREKLHTAEVYHADSLLGASQVILTDATMEDPSERTIFIPMLSLSDSLTARK